MNFVFYDTETTGINTTFDQILQFGAIYTDDQFRELDRINIKCRLLPYVVPAPGAMRVTGTMVEQLTDPNLPTHYDMVRIIKGKLAEWSPAIFIGHNSIDFDERLLRQAFYKNLYPPYLTNTNGNCRMDTLRIIQAVARFEPGALVIPDNNGKPVFKLDRLAPANGFNHEAAHDAIGDVEAMIHICRRIAEAAPGHWSNFLRHTQRTAIADFVNEHEVFSFTTTYFGRSFSYIVAAIGPYPERNDFLLYDLSVEPDELMGLTDQELTVRLGERPKPVRAMRANANPILLSYENTPEEVRLTVPDHAIARARTDQVKNDENFSQRLIAAFVAGREEYDTSEHVEEQIYDGFIENEDAAIMQQFHEEQNWSEKLNLLAQISDARIQTLGQRLVFVEAPEVLDDAARREHETSLARRVLQRNEAPWLTLHKAIEEADDLLANAEGNERTLLTDLREYLIQRIDSATAILD